MAFATLIKLNEPICFFFCLKQTDGLDPEYRNIYSATNLFLRGRKQ
jgi:hypothetical protein